MTNIIMQLWMYLATHIFFGEASVQIIFPSSQVSQDHPHIC